MPTILIQSEPEAGLPWLQGQPVVHGEFQVNLDYSDYVSDNNNSQNNKKETRLKESRRTNNSNLRQG